MSSSHDLTTVDPTVLGHVPTPEIHPPDTDPSPLQSHDGIPVPGHEGIPVPGHEGIPVPGHEGIPVQGPEAMPVQGQSAIQPLISIVKTEPQPRLKLINDFHWGRLQVHALISHVEEFFEDFYDETKKKKAVWNAVADRMQEEGHNCTGAECDKKWRNLKGTYVKVLQKQIHGETSYRFEYFDALHHILGKEIDPLGMREQALSQNSTVAAEEDMSNSSDYHEIAMDGNFAWTNEAVNLLLDLILEFKPIGVDEVWEEIEKQMNEASHAVQSDQCHRKWINLQEGFRFHQNEAEVLGSVPLWPFFTRVRHVMNTVNAPTTPKGKIVSSGLRVRGGLEMKPSLESSGNKRKNILERIKNVESSVHINQRLDQIEARVMASKRQQNIYAQTNTLLSKVLSELRDINRSLEQEQPYQATHQYHHTPHMSTSDQPQVQRQEHEPGSPNQGYIIVTETYGDNL